MTQSSAEALKAIMRESMRMDPPPKGPPTNIPEVAQAIRDSKTEPRRNPKRARSTPQNAHKKGPRA